MAAVAAFGSSSFLLCYSAAVAIITTVAAATTTTVAANSLIFGFITRINKKGAAKNAVPFAVFKYFNITLFFMNMDCCIIETRKCNRNYIPAKVFIK